MNTGERQRTGLPRLHRRRGWLAPAAVAAFYAAGLAAAHLLRHLLPDLTLAAYAVADIGGLAFILRYVRTEWHRHPWGRHVMAFMICLEVIFTLALSRRIFGEWVGVDEILFLASWTFAGVIWRRYQLQVQGERRTGPHD